VLGLLRSPRDRRFNTALCVHGDGILGNHRTVHQPAGESITYSAGERLSAFDAPAGRIGMLIDYDKTFPEPARQTRVRGRRPGARRALYLVSRRTTAP
jgi:predicted amidohydrolase